MIALLILGLISSVCTAPHDHGSWYPHYHEHHHDYHHEHDHEYHHDHNGPWHHHNHSQFDNNNYNHLIHLPPVVSQEGVVGNEYIITVPLSRFDKTEILVMAHEGYVSIKAYHKCLVGYNDRIYENSRILPTTVDLNGKWTYESGVLKIVFPLKGSVETQTVRVIGTDLTTALPIPTNNKGNYDIDERFSA